MLILSGKEPSDLILNRILNAIKFLKKKPCFAIVQVGSDPASCLYLGIKRRKAEEIGIRYTYKNFDKTVSFEELKNYVLSLNADHEINGIIIQLPLPDHLKNIIYYIDSKKDIDGLSVVQQGNLMLNFNGLYPCTAIGVMKIFEYYNIELKNKKIAVVGRSNLVGKPLALLLLNKNALVTIFHSKINKDVFHEEIKNFDIICSAVGKKNLIKDIKEGAILISIGVDKEKNEIFTDFNEVCYKKASAYTPMPGGTGLLTIACLMENIYKAFLSQNSDLY